MKRMNLWLYFSKVLRLQNKIRCLLNNFLIPYFVFLIMIISLVVAASENNVIGKNNQLLWHLPKDMKFFKNVTWGMPVVMGRKTFESMKSKPLPGRKNIVITRQPGWNAEGVSVVDSVDAAASLAESQNYKEIFIMGG